MALHTFWFDFSGELTLPIGKLISEADMKN